MATKSTKPEPPSGGGEERSPDQIETEIEATREDMGETVAELADKADIKKQARRKVTETKAKATAKKDELKETATAKKEAATAKVADAAPDSARDGAQQAAAGAQQAAAQARRLARENPIPTAAIGAFVGGMLIGWMLARR